MNNPSFQQLASDLPIADFIRLVNYLGDAETKVWRRKVTNVYRRKKGSSSEVGVVGYEPRESKVFKDPGEIETNFLSDRLALMLGKVAKQFEGKECTFFQINKGKSDSMPNGYRELVWIQVIE